MSSIEYLTVGRIVRPHGLKGQVEVISLTDSPQRFKIGAQFKIEPPVVGGDRVTVSNVSGKKDRLLVVFNDFTNRDDAETLIGKELMIPQSKGEKPVDAYWHHEIIGCQVVTVDGRSLGRVSQIVRTGSNDVYVIGDDRRYLIPATKEAIESIDIQNGIIKVKPLPGLIE